MILRVRTERRRRTIFGRGTSISAFYGVRAQVVRSLHSFATQGPTWASWGGARTSGYPMVRSYGRLRVLVLTSLLFAACTFGSVGTAAAVEQPDAFVVVQPQPSGPPGVRVDVVGLGFGPGQRVEIRWDGVDGQLLGQTVGADFTTQMTVPDASAGLHTLVVLSRDANGLLGTATSTGFLVNRNDQSPTDQQQAPKAPASGDAPPVKGTSGILWAAVLGLMLALGLSVAWGRRRLPSGS